LEAAVRIKDARKDVHITAISLGDSPAKPVLNKAVACGADALILLDDPAFADPDSFTTAAVLSQAIQKNGAYDLILCGRQAADTDAGLVGPGIAELLGIPLIPLAKNVEIAEDKVRVESITDEGFDILEAHLPCLVSVSNELGELRYPPVKALMQANKSKPLIWDASFVNGDILSEAKVEKADMSLPVRQADLHMIEAESAAESGAMLADRLRQDGVI
jgi:electron transfer flavoprotein beta subunit